MRVVMTIRFCVCCFFKRRRGNTRCSRDWSSDVCSSDLYGVVFGTCKSAVDRMARDMAIELKPHNVASISLWLGLTFTERAARALEAQPEMKASIVTNPDVGASPEFAGRAIAALA